MSTRIMDPDVQAYIKQTLRYKPLTRLEEVETATLIQEGDKKALDTLVNANLRFVISLARNYENQGVALLDLISSGNEGLIRAAKKFDCSKNFKFISYAVWWIRQAILKQISEQSRFVNIPLHISTHIGTAYREYYNMQGSDVSKEEMKKKSSLNPKIIDDFYSVIRTKPVSLNSYVNTSCEGLYYMDTLMCSEEDLADTITNKNSTIGNIKLLLKELKPPEQRVLALYFGLGGEAHTLQEIGHQLKLTRERVRQIKFNALKKLKAPINLKKILER